MLLMQNNVVSSYVRSREESHRRAHHHQQQHTEFKPPPWTSAAAAAAAAASLDKFWPHEALEHPVRQLNWASVASWFMRPEARAAAPAQDTLPAPTVCTSIRCTVPGCSCECFTPGKLHIRYCESCSHGWVPHALDKLGFRHMLGQNAVEPVQLNVAFDIASLVLYGCQALPIRLKILLDRLFSVLQRDEVVQVLRGFGWTQDDYARGYILQEPHGAVLDRWNICSPEEEPLVLQQFLRFGETRAITQQLLMHGLSGGLPRAAEADIKRLLDARDEQRRGSLGGGGAAGIGSKPTNPHPPPPPVSQSQVQQPVQQLPPPPVTVHSRTQPPPPSIPSQQAPLSPQHKLGFRLPPTGLTCTPATTPSSPPTSSASSPLNKLQNMRPFDFRKITLPERRRASEDNPQNLSLSNSGASVPVCLPPPPPAPSSVLGHKSPSSDFYHGSTAASSEFGSEDDEDDEENSQSALNLSRDSPGFVKQRLSHHRKSVTPVKRHWGSSGLPANLGTQLINPATGKKRVQCNVCLKTFCDKGALKIHYSAVHLREMHKCTVEGCNMMFSSRRSRNRHSANPNPKLHSPHLRRKISPHDGRSSQNHPLLMPPLAGLSPLSFGPFPLLTPPPPELRHQAAALDLKQSLDLTAPRRDGRKSSGNESSDQADDFVMYDDDEDGIVIEGDEDMVSQNGEKSADDGAPASKMPRYKLSESEDDDVASNVEDSNEDSLSVVDSQSLKEESGPENLVTKSSRKRKNQNPTRCPVSASSVTHEGLSDDDSCNDVYQRRSPEKRSTEVDKCQDLTVKALDEEVDNNNTIPMKKEPVEKYAKDEGKGDKEPNDLRVRANNEEATNLCIKRESSPNDVKEDGKNVEIKSEENAVESSNALRHLESLSQGHFGSESYRHQSQGDPPSPARSNASSGSSNGDSDAEVYGHFQDGAFVAAMEVPIDKDNPRMCTACGKVFQNHFSVKTHYQNVHLKLMHKCTVDGCNAAFPSKRSRDRHSANLNLHRKLLSTSLTDKAAASLFLESHLAPHTLHPEFLARLYADTHLPPANLLNGDRLVPGHPLFPYPLGLASFRGFPHLAPPLENGGRSSSVGSHSPRSDHASPHLVLADDDDDARPDSDGRLACRFCSAKTFDSSQRLREHIELSHLSDCHRCTQADCPLVFISMKRRNLHLEDETAHPLPPS